MVSLRDSFGPDQLAELLRAFAGQQASGVLDVWSAWGRKRVEMQDGLISMVASPARKRFRLGDILVAQGKLKESELQDALIEQRQQKGRRLGEALVSMGLVTRDEIVGVIRFQIQEEVYDLFLWDEGEYEFHEGENLEEEITDRERGVLLALSPGEVLEEAARRSVEWREIHAKIGSMNAVFRLTPMGRKMRERATRSGQRLLSLVEEGNTVEGIVRKSFRGRFLICKALSELVDAGALEEVGARDLTALAEDFTEKNSFAGAIGVLARMLEIETSERGRLAIMRKIEAAEVRLLSTGKKTLGLESDEMRAVARPGAKPSTIVAAQAREAHRRRMASPLTAALAVAFIVALGVAVYFFPPLRRVVLGEDLAAHRQRTAGADGLVSENR